MSLTRFRDLLCWWMHPCTRRVDYYKHMETEVPMFQTLLDFTLCDSSSGYLFVFFAISFTNNANIVVFPWLLWAILANFQTWERGHGNHQSIAGQKEVQVTCAHYLQLVSGIPSVQKNGDPEAVGICTNSEYLVPKWNWLIRCPVGVCRDLVARISHYYLHLWTCDLIWLPKTKKSQILPETVPCPAMWDENSTTHL